MTDRDCMQLALELASRGRGKTSPNPMVGAVLVKDQRIIAKGFHQKFGGPHAEIMALKKAGIKAKGATLYVTLEPCFHYGKTPPCVDAIIKSGVKKVVVAMKDPNPLTKGKSIFKLRRFGIGVKMGILEKESALLNESFIKFITKKMPFVIAKTAQTLDGKIATEKGQSQWITSFKTRQFSKILRNEFDAVLVGINTVLLDNPYLNAVGRKKIKKVVLDSSLQISSEANLFKSTHPTNCIIAVTKKADEKKIEHFRKKGVDVIICPSKNKQISLKWLLRKLASKGIANLLIEGGAKVIGSALKEKCVDKMRIFIAPKIMGDQAAMSSIQGIRVSHVSKAIRLKDIYCKKIGQDLFLEGYL